MSDPTSRPLGVAVVGYSFMGKAHSHAWRNVGAFHADVPPVTQRVLVGRDESAVKEAAGRYGWAETATDWQSLMGRDDIDIVDICTPGNSHAEIAIAALEAGKHVLVEKPLANSVPEGEAMVAAAATAAARGVASMVGFNYRRVPALALAREEIARRSDRRGARGAGGVPPGLAGRRRGADDLAAAQGERRVRCAGGPGLARRRPGALPARRAGDRGERPPAHVRGLADRGRRSGAGHGRRRGMGDADGGVRRGRQRRGVADGHRPQERADHRGLRQPRLALLRPRAAQRAAGELRAGARDRARPPLRRCLVAAGPRARLGQHLHLAGGRLPDRDRHGAAPEPSFADGLAVQRVLAAIEQSAAASGASVDVVQKEN